MGNWEVHFDVLAWTSARMRLCSAQLPPVMGGMEGVFNRVGEFASRSFVRAPYIFSVLVG